jgi:hypothetical protein
MIVVLLVLVVVLGTLGNIWAGFESESLSRSPGVDKGHSGD